MLLLYVLAKFAVCGALTYMNIDMAEAPRTLLTQLHPTHRKDTTPQAEDDTYKEVTNVAVSISLVAVGYAQSMSFLSGFQFTW